jgi:5'-methylthioadenosine nucleosidase
MNRLMSFILMTFYIIFNVSPLQAQTSIINQRPIKKILLVVAMDTEALPIVNAFNLKKSPHFFSDLPMQGYVGKYGNLDILLVQNGKDTVYKVQNVGTQAATLATYVGIEHFHPDLVISIGTAGGIAENGAKIGDIYISQKIYFYGRRIPIPGYTEYGMGGYASANFNQITNKINVKQGIVCAGDSFDDNQTDREIILKNDCSVREMESAGVAWVSMIMKTPMLAMKGITDIVWNKSGQEQFEKNFSPVNKKLSEKVKEFLRFLSTNS